jgi:7-cyano-7-deazaguanine tRNA-ribosyltransferase
MGAAFLNQRAPLPKAGGPPFVWLGHDLKSPFHVWEHVTGCQGVCLSAAQVLTKPGFNRAFRTDGLREVLAFKGRVFLDSGGFRFQRLAQEEFDASHVLELYQALGPDIGAILDFPFDPTKSNRVNSHRWRRTLRNTQRMRDAGLNISLAPVIHAYDRTSAAERYRQLLEVFPDPEIICIGSLVPLLKASYIGSRFPANGSLSAGAERWTRIAEVVTTIRELAPKTPLHVFGAGSLSTISMLLLLGIDSVDSTGWRMKAAFGAIQLPGLGDRFTVPSAGASKVRRGLSPLCRDILSKCDCPACDGESLSRRVKKLSSSFTGRAVHNAHVLLSEVRLLGSAMRRNQGGEFVAKRFRTSPRYEAILMDAVLPHL